MPAVGSLSEVLDLLAGMLADSPAWQTMSESATAEEARGKVHLASAPVTRQPPFAIVQHAPGFSRERVAVGQAAPWDLAGEVLLYLAGTPAAGAGDESMFTFCNAVEAVLDDITALAGLPGRLNLIRIELEDGPQRIAKAHRDRHGDRWEILLTCAWSRR